MYLYRFIGRVFGLETHVEVKPLHNFEVQSQHQSVIVFLAVVSFFAPICYGTVMFVFQSQIRQSFHFPFRLIGRHVQRVAVFVFQHGVRGLVTIHVGVVSHTPVALGAVIVYGKGGLGVKPARQFDVVSQRCPIALQLVVARVKAVAQVVKGKHVAVDVVSSA